MLFQYILLVIAEILAISLRENQNIEGITLDQIRNLLNQFADDMDIFSLATKESITAIYEELDRFKRHSGFTVSYEKNTIYRIGSLRHSNATMYNLDQYKWSNEDITVLGVTIAHENIIEKNYEDIITKAKKTLNAWHNRGLTLIGKIQVVNTLIASLFGYKMMVLPAIPRIITKSMDNIIREFIWGGKKSKISYEILQTPKQEGGLGLVNLSNKDTSLKATWPQILHEETDYAKMVYNILRTKNLQDDIWRCHLLPEHVPMLKIKSTFWQDVLISWSKFNYYNDFRVENQIIWYNSCILVGKKPVYWGDAHKRGLKYVHQLFNQQVLKTDEQVLQEFGISKMRYNSLKSALPASWKAFFQRNPKQAFFPIPPHNLDMAIQSPYKTTKMIYRYVSNDRIVLHNKYIKWRIELGYELTESLSEFTKYIREIYNITNITKYRSFQYRLITRGLVTKIQLSKWKITESDMCHFCDSQRETIPHLLYECSKVEELWETTAEYIRTRFGVTEIHMDTQSVILNQIVPQARHVANFLCLVTKQYIYSQKCLNKDLSTHQLQAKFKHLERVEKYIAIKNGKITTHERKWGLGLSG